MFATKIHTKRFRLFADQIRLLTGQDEVTNTLMDRVARYIEGSLRLHFAIEQLGLTWKEVLSIAFAHQYDQQVRCEGNTEANITRIYRKYILTIKERTCLFH